MANTRQKSKAVRKPDGEKVKTSFSLTSDGLAMLANKAAKLGTSQSALLEIMIRQFQV